MRKPTSPKPSEASTELDLELLRDLERQSVDEIRKLRAHERMDVDVNIVVQPGNSSQLGQMTATVRSKDISGGGCSGISPVPLGVGDIYRLEFERSKLDVPMVFARCVRCRMIRENAFEVGMSFFAPIDLGEPKKGAGKKSLLD